MIKQELEQTIAYHDYAYWILHNPVISDAQYDEYVNQLKTIDPENPLLIKIHDITQSNNKIKHMIPMLSLDKVYSYSSLCEYLSKISRSIMEEFIISPKYDGCAGRMYNPRILTTRGDGYNGIDISSKLKNIKLISSSNISWPIDGEIIFTKSQFKNLSIRRKDGSPYKTIRNCIAGLLATDNPIQSNIEILFVDYNWFSKTLSLSEIFNEQNWNHIIDTFCSLDYPLDGIVIKLKDQKYFNYLGTTRHHPRGSIAFKFANSSQNTKLIQIKWQVGTTSKLTPVGIVEPVIINQVEINKINLHNAKYIIENDLYINDIVKIQRSGDVIPDYVETITKPVDRIKPVINVCPNCNSQLIYKEPNLYCTNKECSIPKQLVVACERIGLQLLGPATIEKLYTELGIDNVLNILKLEEDQIKSLTGFQDQSVNNIYNEIQRIRSSPIYDYQIFASLMVPGIGKTIYKQICKWFSISELLNISYHQLLTIPGIGDERGKLIYTSIQSNKNYLIELGQMFTHIIESKSKTQLPKICFSGKANISRQKLRQIAESKGYEFVNSITKSLDLLVIDDINKSTSKIKKAKKFGIKIITYDEWDIL